MAIGLLESNPVYVLLPATWIMPYLWEATSLFCSLWIDLPRKHTHHRSNMNATWQRESNAVTNPSGKGMVPSDVYIHEKTIVRI